MAEYTADVAAAQVVVTVCYHEPSVTAKFLPKLKHCRLAKWYYNKDSFSLYRHYTHVYVESSKYKKLSYCKKSVHLTSLCRGLVCTKAYSFDKFLPLYSTKLQVIRDNFRIENSNNGA